MGLEPVRTCVGCRERGPRSSLVRIAAGPESVGLDLAGGRQGRGAHVHPRRECVALAARPGVLARALRRGLGEDEVGRLMRQIERMGAA